MPDSLFYFDSFGKLPKLRWVYFRTKTVKGTPLLQLVESYRNSESQPRQRVIASLGDASLPEDEKRGIAKAVESALRGADRLACERNTLAKCVELGGPDRAIGPQLQGWKHCG